MNPWEDRLDTLGQPHASVHRDGHRVVLYDGEWWAYHAEHRWTPPGCPRIGPEPAGPFHTLDEAKQHVEAQGFTSAMPFERSA